MKKLIHLKNLNYSSALMIDQRVSQGIKSDFFSQKALTTTIPSQYFSPPVSSNNGISKTTSGSRLRAVIARK